MSDLVQSLQGRLDEHTWKATWSSPFPSNDEPAPGAWEIVVDGHIPLPRVLQPNPITGSEVCRGLLESAIREWLTGH